MRANTSLIGHILGSHPHINGYYEMHQSYLSEDDLLIQQQRYLLNDSIKEHSHYFFDKLLHNEYQLVLNNIDLKKVIVFVSIRSPEQSIKSILHLFRQKKQQHSYAIAERAIDYYRCRLSELVSFCKCYHGQYYYYDADLIRNQPQKLLPIMKQWLSLNSALKEDYQLFSQTGCRRAGDSSENMKTGTIIKQQNNYKDIIVSQNLLNDVIKETEQQRLFIINHAIAAVKL